MANERIFISYKRVNKVQVFSLVDRIERALGVKCWVDLEGVESMAQFASKICRAIDGSDIVLFMHSSAHLGIDFERDWTIRELSYADHKQKRTVLIKLDNAPLENYFLLMFGALNYTEANNPERFNRLLGDMRHWLKLDNTVLPPNPPVVPPRPVSKDKVFKVGGVQFKMVYVEGGTFTMGATPEQGSNAKDDEKPAHKVTLDSYYIGETQVTWALWRAFMGNDPRYTEPDNYPVTYVLWEKVQKFIQKLNQATGRVFRMPTEAEWEYAARGGNKSRGYKYAGSNNIDEVAWFGKHPGALHPVKGKKTNELGLYDMSGNVYEWCSDIYSVEYYRKSPDKNPYGSTMGSDHVVRGGAYFSSAEWCRVSSRDHEPSYHTSCHLGCRLVLEP